MNVRNRRSGRRRGQAILRMVLGLGAAVAGATGYLSSGAIRVEALILPSVVMGLFFVGLVLYGRARARRQWSAAWDVYAQREGAPNSVHYTRADEAWSWAGTN
jgi:hypothetical protein